MKIILTVAQIVLVAWSAEGMEGHGYGHCDPMMCRDVMMPDGNSTLFHPDGPSNHTDCSDGCQYKMAGDEYGGVYCLQEPGEYVTVDISCKEEDTCGDCIMSDFNPSCEQDCGALCRKDPMTSKCKMCLQDNCRKECLTACQPPM